MVNVLVGQFLPDGVVKGGSSLKLRYGNDETRVTTDFDAAAKDSRDEFIEEFQARLSQGWEGFSFQVIAKEPARPRQESFPLAGDAGFRHCRLEVYQIRSRGARGFRRKFGAHH